MPTARSTPNIAFVKYWGNRNNTLRLPAADSISMTLDSPVLDVAISHADQIVVRSFDEHENEKALTEKNVTRFGTHLELTKAYLKTLDVPDAIPSSLSITIHSSIPPAIGLASSAAVFSALAKAIGCLIREQIPLSDEQMSVIARLGSGSAGRSIYGGYAALIAGSGEEIDASSAIQRHRPCPEQGGEECRIHRRSRGGVDQSALRGALEANAAEESGVPRCDSEKRF
ncbi:hypothetical protein HYW84_02935 [Candidatus Peregrinibacteria bacterium]|nr:hypothetical protein [Candidatus Peregrinibacteria bacterium]